MYGGSVVVASLLVMFFQAVNPPILASFRVAVMLLIVVFWQQIVELLISNDFVHPMRRSTAVAFRWRFLVLVVVLELLVIQQIPTMFLDALNI